MRRLICAFVVRIWQKQVFSWPGSNTTSMEIMPVVFIHVFGLYTFVHTIWSTTEVWRPLSSCKPMIPCFFINNSTDGCKYTNASMDLLYPFISATLFQSLTCLHLTPCGAAIRPRLTSAWPVTSQMKQKFSTYCWFVDDFFQLHSFNH